jgi:hypothetical protein
MIGLLAMYALPLATPTQEEVFQSINQNVGSTVDMSKAVPYLLVAVGAAIMAGLYNYHRKRRANPGRLNSAPKLTREICRRISLRSLELKQLKILADDQEVEYPLTLILCPSLLGKAIRAPGPHVDRAVVRGIVDKLKRGLGDRGE